MLECLGIHIMTKNVSPIGTSVKFRCVSTSRCDFKELRSVYLKFEDRAFALLGLTDFWEIRFTPGPISTGTRRGS